MGRKKNDTTDILEEGIVEQEIHDAAVEPASVELSESEKIALEKEARAEVLKQMKLSEAKRFKAAAKQRIQAEMMFRSAKDGTGANLVTVSLLLASHPKYIMLDGAVYHSGRKYTVSKGVAAVLLDQMHRGWEQEYARLNSEERGNLRRQRNFVLKQTAEGETVLAQV